MKQSLRIRGLEIPVDFPELTELEKSALVQTVEDRFELVERQTKGKVVDTLRLALVTALDLAHELQSLKAGVDSARRVDENSIDQMIGRLRGALEGGP
jgi:cell division protein ZapA (FtsZ GTPase activity inhibitor)